MKKTGMATAAALSLGAMLVLAPIVMAQGGGGGGGGGNRGQRGFGGLMGTIEEISDTELTISVMNRGGRPGGGRPQQGGDQPAPRLITVKLNGETAYRELVDGKEDDLVKGAFVSAAGDGEDTIDAKAIATCEAAPEDTEGTGALRALMLIRMPLYMIAMRGQQGGGNAQERPQIGFAMGELINEIPYTVKARTRDGERDVTLTVADATRYFKVSEGEHDKLVKGRMVSIAPVPPQDGQGRPGGQAGNGLAFEPRQGGEQPARDITAAMIMLLPEMQRPGGGAPPQ